MQKLFIFFTLIFIFCGCATNANFVEGRNMYVGSKISWDPQMPPQIRSYNLTQDEYIFESKNGCQWAYCVNKKTGVIESWKYISSPDKCTEGYNWFGPW